MENENYFKMHGTTIIAVRRDGHVAFAGDGQVSMGNMVMKGTAKKVMKIAHGKVIAGFAGSVADSLTLLERFEEKLEKYNTNLPRAARELARDWRTDKFLRKLEALLLVADKEHLFLVSGTGEVIEPDEDVAAIGSGGPMALAAARALIQHSPLSAEEIAKESIKIAASICVFTNDQITLEVLE